MRSRVIVLVGVALALALAVGAQVLVLSPSAPPVRFTEDMVERIYEGMTEEEVVGVLGRPPGWYASPDIAYFGSGPMGYWVQPEGWTLPKGDIDKGWISDAGAVCVTFGRDGRVARRDWMDVYAPEPESAWQRFLRKAKGLFQ
jgi:hypothetical protein